MNFRGYWLLIDIKNLCDLISITIVVFYIFSFIYKYTKEKSVTMDLRNKDLTKTKYKMNKSIYLFFQ